MMVSGKAQKAIRDEKGTRCGVANRHQIRDCPCMRLASLILPLERSFWPFWEGSGKQWPASQETCHLVFTQPGRGVRTGDQRWL